MWAYDTVVITPFKSSLFLKLRNCTVYYSYLQSYQCNVIILVYAIVQSFTEVPLISLYIGVAI
jgi:hypothetical protein